MKETYQNESNIIKKYIIIYGICIIITLIAPIFFIFSRIPSTGQFIINIPLYFTFFLLGGWFGVIFILFAFYYLYYGFLRRAVICGFLGGGFIGFNMLYIILVMVGSIEYSFLTIINVLTPMLLLISLVGINIINWRVYQSISQLKEKRAIESRSNAIITLLSLLYLIIIFFFFISLILSFLEFLNRGIIVIVFLIVGLFFIVISLISLLRELKIRQSIVFGITGITFLLILEFRSPYLNYSSLFSSSSIRVVFLTLVLILNIILLKYRLIAPTPLSERITMIKESGFSDIVRQKEYPEDDKFRQEKVESPKKKVKSKNILSANEVEKRLTPEELEEQRKTEAEMGIEKKEFICIVHKGTIDGPIYLCPYCHTLYCQKCASALKEKSEKCWSCDTEINL